MSKSKKSAATDDNQRRGPLSQEEKKYITQYSAMETCDSIATKLRRNPDRIRKYVTDNNLESVDIMLRPEEDREILRELYKLEWWPSMKDQLTEEELLLFEQQWMRIYKQFDCDVLPTEGVQIQKFITVNIMMGRAMKRIKENTLELDNMQKQYDEEMKYQSSLDKLSRDRTLLTAIMSDISNLRLSLPTLNKEYNELAKQHQMIEKGISGSRDQRVKNIQDGSKNWSSLLRLLEDPKIRREVGQHIEVMRAARDKEMGRLTQLHKFINNEFDMPILAAEFLPDEADHFKNVDKDSDGNS